MRDNLRGATLATVDATTLPAEEDMNPSLIIPVVDSPEFMTRHTQSNDVLTREYISNHADVDLIEGLDILDYGDRIDGTLYLVINDETVEMNLQEEPISGSDMQSTKDFIDKAFALAKRELDASEKDR